MDTKKLILSFLVICSFALQGNAQQLPNWSSFYENGYIWNPALTARWNYWEVSATQRQEWLGFEGAPQTTTLGFQLPFSRSYTTSSLGMFVMRDQVGPYTNLGLTATYSYKIRTRLFGNENDGLTFGMSANIGQHRFSNSDLTAFDGLVDPNLFNESFTRMTPNVGVGFFYSSVSNFYSFQSHYFFGVSANNLVPSSLFELPIGDASTATHINAHAGFRYYPKGAKHFFEPNILLSYAPSVPMTVMGNLRFEKVDKYWLALGAVTNGEIFGQIGLSFDERSALASIVGGGVLKLGVKVDHSVGSIQAYRQLGYELYLAYIFEKE